MEIWKDIKGYEGFYQVSNYGRVKSLERLDSCGRKVHGRILKQGKDTQGYLVIGLCKEGARKSKRIHRLVAEMFIENPKEYLEVNHKDENKENNHIDNLEWCDREYNGNYGTIKERIGKSNKGKLTGSKNPKARKVRCINTGEEFPTVKEASKHYNISDNTIRDMMKGRQKTAGKHPITGERLKWEYVKEVI